MKPKPPRLAFYLFSLFFSQQAFADSTNSCVRILSDQGLSGAHFIEQVMAPISARNEAFTLLRNFFGISENNPEQVIFLDAKGVVSTSFFNDGKPFAEPFSYEERFEIFLSFAKDLVNPQEFQFQFAKGFDKLFQISSFSTINDDPPANEIAMEEELSLTISRNQRSLDFYHALNDRIHIRLLHPHKLQIEILVATDPESLANGSNQIERRLQVNFSKDPDPESGKIIQVTVLDQESPKPQGTSLTALSEFSVMLSRTQLIEPRGR